VRPENRGRGARSNSEPGRSIRAGRVVRVRESVEELSRRLGTAPPDVLSVIFEHWSEVVGETVADHAFPERLEAEALVIRVDSPAWASHLRTHASTVLTKLHRAAGADSPSRLVVRVGHG
jgi:predicted nucleic acid-binding Zn ribbon protein